ncbi:MAG: ShlB/FhaC/HecB family hemolysin secretion/activation protein [Gammaproteobacteria bacterium]
MRPSYWAVVFLAGCLPAYADMAIPGRPSAEALAAPDFVRTKQPPFTLPPAPQVVIPEQASNGEVRIMLRAVRIEGNTVFSDEQLLAVAEPYIGRPVTLTELEALRQAFTQHYIDNGYVNSGAVLPDQTFSNGVLRFRIIEGVLNTINVSGTGWLNPAYVSDRLRLAATGPLNFNALQERFQMLLTDPLIERMYGQLQPGEKPGESIFDVHVVRERPYQLTLGFDNHRPPSVGAEEGRLNGWLRNLTGWGDEWNMDLFYSAGSLAGGGGVTLPLTPYDTRAHFDFNLSHTTVVEQPLADLDINSRYSGYNYALIQPLYQSFHHNLTFGSTLSIRQNRMQMLGFFFPFSAGDNDVGRSQSTAVRNALEYTYRDERQAFALRSTLSVGVHAFGATWWNNQRPDSDFVSWLNQIQYARQINDNGTQVLFNSSVQWSNDTLLPLERFALGGAHSVRGYRENELVRDKGYLVAAELRYPLFDNGDNGFPGRISLAPFVDYGAAWNRGFGEYLRELCSIGTGLIWIPFRRVYAEIYYAHALTQKIPQPQENLQDKGIHFNVSISAF